MQAVQDEHSFVASQEAITIQILLEIYEKLGDHWKK